VLDNIASENEYCDNNPLLQFIYKDSIEHTNEESFSFKVDYSRSLWHQPVVHIFAVS